MNREHARRRVLVFLKAPRPGLAKTRLAEALGAEAAAAIHRVLVDRTLAVLANYPEVELCFTPDDASGEIQSWLRPGWSMQPQGPGDLGARIDRALRANAQTGALPLIVIGTDCPALAVADIEEGFAALSDHEVTLGPAADGGYWLIGLRASYPALFHDIPWSTPQVLETTLQRAEAAGLRVKQLRVLRDIDTLEDWRHWLRTQPVPEPDLWKK